MTPGCLEACVRVLQGEALDHCSPAIAALGRKLGPQSSELLYWGIWLYGGGATETGIGYLREFIARSEIWGKELAIQCLSGEPCQACREHPVTCFAQFAAVCETCRDRMADRETIEENFRSPTPEFHQWVTNLCGDLYPQVAEQMSRKQHTTETPLWEFTPELPLRKLLNRLGAKGGAVWHRALALAKAKPKAVIGTRELGLALAEGRHKRAFFGDYLDQRALRDVARDKPVEPAGANPAVSDQALWTLNIANWLSMTTMGGRPEIDPGKLQTALYLAWADEGAADIHESNPWMGQATPEQMELFEQLLLRRPDSLVLNLFLMSYYRQRSWGKGLDRLRELVTWLIRHHPLWTHDLVIAGDGTVDRTVMEELVQAVYRHAGDASIIAHLAELFAWYAPDLTQGLLLHAHTLAPQDRFVESKLAQRQRENPPIDSERRRSACAAVASLDCLDPEDAETLLGPALMEAEIKDGNLDRAFLLGDWLIAALSASDLPRSSATLHQAHTSMGVVHLGWNDVSLALDHLHRAGDSIRDGRPAFRLVNALLEHGEKEACLEYLDQCEGVLTSEIVRAWKEEIENGALPNFPKGSLD